MAPCTGKFDCDCEECWNMMMSSGGSQKTRFADIKVFLPFSILTDKTFPRTNFFQLCASTHFAEFQYRSGRAHITISSPDDLSSPPPFLIESDVIIKLLFFFHPCLHSRFSTSFSSSLSPTPHACPIIYVGGQ